MATVTYSLKTFSTPEVLTDSFTVNDQGSPSITRMTNGEFVVSFDHFGTTQIALTAYDPGLTFVNFPPEFEVAPVNTTTAGDQFGSESAALSGGGFVTLFNDLSSGQNQLRYRVFSENGVALGSDALVFEGFFATRAGGVAGMTNGDFVVAFEAEASATDFDVDYAVFGANGVLKGGFAAEDAPAVDAVAPDIAALANGGFVLAWSEVAASGDTDVYLRRYNAGAGGTYSAAANKGLVDGIGAINDQVAVIGLDDGGFAIAYRDSGWGSVTDISLRFYNANGSARTTIMRANQISDGAQEKPSLALLENGFVVVTWQTAAAAAPGNTDIACRIYDPNGNAITGQYAIASSASAESDADAAGLYGGIFAHVYETADTSLDGSGSGVAMMSSVLSRTITGDATSEFLLGDELRDTIVGGDGGDLLFGGGENDELEGGIGADHLDGGTGSNKLIYKNSVQGVEVNLATGTGKFGEAEGDTIALGSFYLVEGSLVGADRLIGDALFNSLLGRGGNDTLDGGGGHNYLFGQDGNDLLIAGAGGTGIFNGGDGVDTISYEGAAQGAIVFLDGGLNAGAANGHDTSSQTIENAVGSGHADTFHGRNGVDNLLLGEGGTDTLLGLGGNDTLDGGAGADTMDGGAGDDLLIVSNAGDLVIEAAGGGADAVHTAVSYTLAATAEVELLRTVAPDALTPLSLTGNGFSQRVQGNAGENALGGGGGADTLQGGLGVDALTGGTGGDVFDFDALAEIGLAAGVRDVIADFQQGADLIDLDGVDALATQAGLQHFTWLGTAAHTGTGATLRYQHAGGNTLVYGDVNADGSGDFALQLTGLFSLTAADFAADTIRTVQGTSVADLLFGGAGANSILGQDGDDTIVAGAGADTILGGGGVDLLTGDAGADLFKWNTASHTGLDLATRDVIADFQQGIDLIDLSAIDANSTLAGNQDFTFLGTAPHTGAGATLRYTQFGGNTTVWGDTDADGAGDFAIQIVGLVAYTAADFVA